MLSSKTQKNLWGIVLAGGEGRRMSSLTEQWLGQPTPKQYCTFVGNRSMLQHTFDRVIGTVQRDRILTVIGQGHESYLSGALPHGAPGRILVQPENRDTAPGIFLPATYVMAADTDATLLILPSDHYIYPESRFTSYLQQAARFAENHPDKIVLLGAVPDMPESDYGWIAPGSAATAASAWGIFPVMKFREKPTDAEARLFFENGWLCNTLIMAVKARTLWALGQEHLPGMMRAFEWLRNEMPVGFGRVPCSECEFEALRFLYSDLTPASFAYDLLQHAPERSVVLPMVDVEWSDWGRPERIVESLIRRGSHPLFRPQGREKVAAGDPLPISA